MAVADRKSHVEVGAFAVADGDELVPRSVAHGFYDALVFHAGGDNFLVDHFVGEAAPIAERLGGCRSGAAGRKTEEDEQSETARFH